MMSTCYSYLCIAVSTSLEMGLYTDVATYDLSEEERLCRNCIFTVLHIMDTYVTVALGVPRTLWDIGSPQTLPSSTKLARMAGLLASTYAHAELIEILAAAVESIHPVTRPVSQKNGFHGFEYCKIVAIEDRLEAWFARLPPFPTTTATTDDAVVAR